MIIVKYNVCTYCDDDDNDNLDVVRRHCALPSLWRSRRLHWQCVCLGGDGDVGDHGDDHGDGDGDDHGDGDGDDHGYGDGDGDDRGDGEMSPDMNVFWLTELAEKLAWKISP